MIGQTLSHYRISASLGAGGMGEVYRATDTNLGRDVAIKVLPPAVAGDEERLGRFRREAQLLAALNHPHVAQVYGLEHAAGQPFLVLELVEGEDLAVRLARGPMPVEEAVEVARQIAEALEEAHEKGIVHRDLKPANVKLTPDGSVKVLDFGLAKALGADEGSSASSAELSHSPTLAHTGTRAGVILGTAAYMSPEQARGKSVDRRADIWAFGVVLFEMLIGRRLFVGDTVSDTLASVLKEEPDWGALPPALPPRIRELLQRCLNRDPRRRLQSIGEARVLLEDTTAGAATTAPTVVLEAAPSEARARAWVWQALSLVLALAVVALVALTLLRGRGAPTEVMRFPVLLPEGTNLVFDQFTAVALSRDGRRQVTVVRGESGPSQLAFKQNDQLDTRLLPGTENARAPFFSPDGDWVAYFTESGLYKVSVAGGPPVVVVAGPFAQTRGGAWSDDGSIVFTPEAAGGLKRVMENGGEVRDLTTIDGARNERTHRWPAVLPGGKAVLFTSDTSESTEYYDDARIEAVVVATGERRVVVEQSSRAGYLPSGHLVFARGGSLFAVPFDAARLEVRGSPTLVLQQLATDVASGAAQFDTSEQGTLLYVRGDVAASVNQPVRVDLDGKQQELDLEPGYYLDLSLGPGGRRLATVTASGVGQAVFVADLERGTFSRLTFESWADFPVWSPDGAWIAYAGVAQGGSRPEIFRRPADGSGVAEKLWSAESPVWPLDVSPDGKLLLAAQQSLPSATTDLWVVPLDGSAPAVRFTETPFDEYMAEFSADGRFIAYQSEESGRPEVYVRPFPGPGGRWQVSTDGGLEPHWSSDGKALFYRSRGNLYSVAVETARSFSAGRPVTILEGFSGTPTAGQYAASSDGRQFHVIRSMVRGAQLGQATLLLNWSAEVERLTSK